LRLRTADCTRNFEALWVRIRHTDTEDSADIDSGTGILKVFSGQQWTHHGYTTVSDDRTSRYLNLEL